MQIKSAEHTTQKTNMLQHDPACAKKTHSNACYIRTSDRQTQEVYFGVEVVEDTQLVVTKQYRSAEQVPTEPDKVDNQRVFAALSELARQRALVSDDSRAAARLDAAKAKLQELAK